MSICSRVCFVLGLLFFVLPAVAETTKPIYVAPDWTPATFDRSKGYYYRVQVFNAQAAYRGNSWNRAKQVLVTAHMSMPGDPSNVAVTTVERSRPVVQGQTHLLGLANDLLSDTPALYPINLDISMIVSTENRLEQVQTLLNNTSLLSPPFSLAPAAIATATQISKIADEVIRIFKPSAAGGPVSALDLDCSFDPAVGEIKDGYWVIFGTTDAAAHPLPQVNTGRDIQITQTSVKVNGVIQDKVSFVVLRVETFARKGYGHASGTWKQKLDEVSRLISTNKGADLQTRQAVAKQCEGLITDASVLMYADRSFLVEDCDEIVVDFRNRAARLAAALPVVASTPLPADLAAVAQVKTFGELDRMITVDKAVAEQSDELREKLQKDSKKAWLSQSSVVKEQLRAMPR